VSVYKKLQAARIKLQNTKLTKSGKNKFAGYEYFELGDFLPAIQNICHEAGLCGVVSYTNDLAYLNIYDVETNDCIVFTSPMSRAELKGCHDVQNLGAVQTYLRRYLWTAAFEIVEHDALDATTGSVKPEPKPLPKPVEPAKTSSGAAIVAGKPSTKDWDIKITMQPDANEAAWFDAVWSASTTALSFAESDADVMAIFKVNKVVFDEAKSRDSEWFKKLMEEFTKVKTKFKEQA
jgi:hypothetical protein